ncbi:MAG: hypothetical protein K6347_01175 [Campylobacterales bacterium]
MNRSKFATMVFAALIAIGSVGCAKKNEVAMEVPPVVKAPELPDEKVSPIAAVEEKEIIIRAIGMGVIPESSMSPAQALAMGKRAAIADAYRQIGEKIYGIKINATDTIKDMVTKNTTIRTEVNALIRNANIEETVCKDGLCQVSMEAKIDREIWKRFLAAY